MSSTPVIRRRPPPPTLPYSASEDPAPPKREYEVGYGRPPLSTRFGGERGNRPGRKKGSKSRLTILQEELDAIVTVKGEGSMSKYRVACRQLANNAAKGDHRAALAIIRFALSQEADEVQGLTESTGPVYELTPTDEAILARYEQRILERSRSDG